MTKFCKLLRSMGLLMSTAVAATILSPASAQEPAPSTAGPTDTPVTKPVHVNPKHSLLFKPWISGVSAGEPQMQVQRYDDDTYVIRQSIRTNFEGPFLFVLFG